MLFTIILYSHKPLDDLWTVLLEESFWDSPAGENFLMPQLKYLKENLVSFSSVMKAIVSS